MEYNLIYIYIYPYIRNIEWDIYLVLHPTDRKWVSSPQFFEWTNPAYPIETTRVITQLLPSGNLT